MMAYFFIAMWSITMAFSVHQSLTVYHRILAHALKIDAILGVVLAGIYMAIFHFAT